MFPVPIALSSNSNQGMMIHEVTFLFTGYIPRGALSTLVADYLAGPFAKFYSNHFLVICFAVVFICNKQKKNLISYTPTNSDNSFAIARYQVTSIAT